MTQTLACAKLLTVFQFADLPMKQHFIDDLHELLHDERIGTCVVALKAVAKLPPDAIDSSIVESVMDQFSHSESPFASQAWITLAQWTKKGSAYFLRKVDPTQPNGRGTLQTG